MNDEMLKQLCAQLRDAQDEESIHRAAEALRTFLHELQTQARERLLSDAERAFLTLDPQAEQ